MQYDRRLSLDLGEHAIAIYELSNGFDRWARERGYVGADIIDRGATQIGIAYSPERITIVARGSSQFGDWVNNFTPFRARWITRTIANGVQMAPGRIHLGFRLQIERAAIELLVTVRELRSRYPNAAIMVTGHSLGGALATLIRVLLEHDAIPVAATYTFESPRVGNGEWARWYDRKYGSDTFRVVNINTGEQDIVTRVPLSCFGWRHVGGPVILCEGRAYESEKLWEDHRRRNPVGILTHLRVVRRAWLSVAAHLGQSLLRELRLQAGV